MKRVFWMVMVLLLVANVALSGDKFKKSTKARSAEKEYQRELEKEQKKLDDAKKKYEEAKKKIEKKYKEKLESALKYALKKADLDTANEIKAEIENVGGSNEPEVIRPGLKLLFKGGFEVFIKDKNMLEMRFSKTSKKLVSWKRVSSTEFEYGDRDKKNVKIVGNNFVCNHSGGVETGTIEYEE